MSAEPETPPSMDDLLKSADDSLRELGGAGDKPAAKRDTAADERKRKAMNAARELAGKAPTKVNAAQRALEAAARLEAQSAEAREQLAKLTAERDVESERERQEALAARERAEEILRARMARNQPSPRADEERQVAQRRVEEERRRAIQQANQKETQQKLQQTQPSPSGAAPPLAPQPPLSPEKQLERELALQRDNLASPFAFDPAPAELTPHALGAPPTPRAAPPSPARAAPQSPVSAPSGVGRDMRVSGVSAPYSQRQPEQFDAVQIRQDIHKAMSHPAVSKLLLAIFLGPPVLFFAIFFIAVIVKAINGDLLGPRPRAGTPSQCAAQDARRDVKPAYPFTREMAEKRILQGHTVVGKNEFGYPLLQIGDRQIDAHTYYFSLISTRTNTIDLLPEDFFRMGLMLEFACFHKPGTPPMYSIAVAAFQTAAIYGHEEALSRFWNLFDKGHDPQRVFKPRETAREYMRNRDAKWRDPTQ